VYQYLPRMQSLICASHISSMRTIWFSILSTLKLILLTTFKNEKVGPLEGRLEFGFGWIVWGISLKRRWENSSRTHRMWCRCFSLYHLQEGLWWSCKYRLGLLAPQRMGQNARWCSVGALLLRTQIPKRRTARSDIADLLLSTCRRRAILRDRAALRFQQVVLFYQRLVLQHTLRDSVPESRIQRCRLRPAAIIVYRPSVVFELPYRTRPAVGLGDVGKVGLNAHDLEGLRIHLVELPACIEAIQRGYRGADVSHGQWLFVIDRGRVAKHRCGVLAGSGGIAAGQTGSGIVVEDLKLVSMCVALDIQQNQWMTLTLIARLLTKKTPAMVAGEKRRTIE